MKRKKMTSSVEPKGLSNSRQKKLAPHEIEVVKNTVSSMYAKGASYYEMSNYLRIEKSISITPMGLVRYLKMILEEWYSNRITDIERKKAGELLKLQEVEREAWLAWEASKGEKVRRYTGKRGIPRLKSGGQIVIDTKETSESETVETSEGGNPKFLEIIMQCIEKRLALMGAGSGDVPTNPEFLQDKPQTIIFNTYIPPNLAGKIQNTTINLDPVN